jgi:hypothetical protein
VAEQLPNDADVVAALRRFSMPARRAARPTARLSVGAMAVMAAALRSVYQRLVDLGLLRIYAKHRGRLKAVELSGHRTEALSVRATKKGCQYLGRKRHVVN